MSSGFYGGSDKPQCARRHRITQDDRRAQEVGRAVRLEVAIVIGGTIAVAVEVPSVLSYEKDEMHHERCFRRLRCADDFTTVRGREYSPRLCGRRRADISDMLLQPAA